MLTKISKISINIIVGIAFIFLNNLYPNNTNFVKIRFDSIPSNDSLFFLMYKLNIECIISDLSFNKGEKMEFLFGGLNNTLGINNLTIHLFEKNKQIDPEYYNWEQYNDLIQKKLIITSNDNLHDIKLYLKYNFIGSFPLYVRQPDNYFKTISYFSDIEPWYPIKNGVEYDYVEINAPKNLKILFSAFSTQIENIDDNRVLYYFNTKKKTFNPFVLSIINSDSLFSDTLNIRNKILHFHNIDKKSFTQFLSNKPNFKNLLLQLDNHISYIPDSLSILSFYWSNKGTNDKDLYANGRNVGSYILCDTLFLNLDITSFLHEFLHSVFKYKTTFETPGKFFLGESIIEFLTKYYYSKYNIHKEYFNCNNTSFNRYIFYIRQNNVSATDMIYNEGPCLLYEISKEVGTDIFVNDLIELLNSKRNNLLTFSDFIIFLKKTGVSKSTYNKFNRLKKNYKIPKEYLY